MSEFFRYIRTGDIYKAKPGIKCGTLKDQHPAVPTSQDLIVYWGLEDRHEPVPFIRTHRDFYSSFQMLGEDEVEALGLRYTGRLQCNPRLETPTAVTSEAINHIIAEQRKRVEAIPPPPPPSVPKARVRITGIAEGKSLPSGKPTSTPKKKKETK
jgi:hypothetical protein